MLNIFSLKIINYKLRLLSGQITNCADAEHLSVHSSLPWRPCRLATSSSPVTYSLSPRLTILLNNITTITIIIPSTIMVSCHLHTLNLTTTINSIIVTYSHYLDLTIFPTTSPPSFSTLPPASSHHYHGHWSALVLKHSVGNCTFWAGKRNCNRSVLLSSFLYYRILVFPFVTQLVTKRMCIWEH